MKKTFVLIAHLWGFLMCSQVGIKIENPTSILDVNGSLALPVKTITGDYTTTASDYAIISKTIDTNGVEINLPDPAICKTRNSASFLPVVLVGGDGEAFTTSSSAISSVSGANAQQILATKNFIIAVKSSVTFTYSIAVSDILDSTVSSIGDSGTRKIGAILQWASPQPTGSTFAVGNAFSNSSMIFSTGGVDYVDETYYLNGSRTIVMEAGTYNVNIIGSLQTLSTDSVGIRATFAGDQFDMVAVPLQ